MVVTNIRCAVDLSHLLVAFLTLPAGSKNKVAGLLTVDKQLCRLLALRHLVMMVVVEAVNVDLI